jgi:hypothetical protein
VPDQQGCGWICCYLPLWVCDELAKVVDRAQQPGRDDISPPTPGLGGTRVQDLDKLVWVHGRIAVCTVWEVLLRDKRDGRLLDSLGVRLPRLRCK